jgi:putative addiction module component (TIGR02574 family)
MINQEAVSVEEVLRRAMTLSPGDRIRLAERIMETLGDDDGASDPGHAEPDPAWEAEIKRRLAKIDAGEAVMVPWEEVDQKAQEIVNRAANRQVS